MSDPVDGDNPFADPSVQEANDAVEYNPFDESLQQDAVNDDPDRYSPREPLIDAPPPSSVPTVEQLKRREGELLQREQSLVEREKRLSVKEHNLEQQLGKQDNWPFQCYPLAYHNINEEIPPDYRRFVRQFYALYILSFICLAYNWLAILIVWWGSGQVTGTSALLATIYLGVGAVGAWKLWYRSVYYGIRDDSGRKWIMFFIYFFLHICFTILMTLGIPNISAAGALIMFDAFSKGHQFVGFCLLVAFIMWTIAFIFSLYMMKQAHGAYKTSGQSLKKEVAKGVAKELIADQQIQVDK